MESIQLIEAHEIPNFDTSCAHCKCDKAVILRNHIAEANHNARIYTGHKMKFLREPKILQQRLYNQNKKDVMLELEYWLHNSETRHYGISTVTNSFIHPLPEKLTALCECPPPEHQLPVSKRPVVLRPLIMKPLGIDRFKVGGIYGYSMPNFSST